MDVKQKILVCGDTNGNFKQLFTRVDTINKKSGPFEFLLCVGEFFDADNNDELLAYRNGFKNVPIPTYIIGSNKKETINHFESLTDGEICPNLTYLGKRGLYTVSSGLKIAYISGIECTDPNNIQMWNFTKDDVISVKNSCVSSKSSASDYRGIDILLTSQWPKQIHETENNDKLNESVLLSWLALEIRPRYHFCGLNNQFYERQPYRNPASNTTGLELATRFISLAPVGNKEKYKYIYALNVQPVDKMRLIDLLQKTTDETVCPYTTINFSIGTKDNESRNKSAQYFFDLNTSSNDGNNKRKNFGQHDGEKRQRRTFDQEKCWFCLSSTSVEKHLIISIGHNFYIVLPKGPVNETHLLISSVTHIENGSLLIEEDWMELEKFKKALKDFYKSQNKVVTFFERNYRQSHLLINAIAIDASLEWKIKQTIEDKFENYKLQFEVLPKLTGPIELPQKRPYFIIELPDETVMLTKQMKQFPLHFGREIFCTEEILNCEEKIDWNECLLLKEEEIDMVKEIREQFKPFDFTIEEDD